VIGGGRDLGRGPWTPPICSSPALASGTVRLHRLDHLQGIPPVFSRRTALWCAVFQKIDVNEPSIPDAIEILKGLKPYFEDYHKLKYTSDAIKGGGRALGRATSMTAKLPDKAIDVIDESGAAQMLLPEGKRKKTHRPQGGRGDDRHHGADPAPRPCRRTTLPCWRISRRPSRRVVYGQDKPIEALSASIKLARAGPARSPEKPIGCYLFSGPHRRRQDRGRQAARRLARRRAPALRHVGIHGAPYRVAADRRAPPAMSASTRAGC